MLDSNEAHVGSMANSQEIRQETPFKMSNCSSQQQFSTGTQVQNIKQEFDDDIELPKVAEGVANESILKLQGEYNDLFYEHQQVKEANERATCELNQKIQILEIELTAAKNSLADTNAVVERLRKEINFLKAREKQLKCGLNQTDRKPSEETNDPDQHSAEEDTYEVEKILQHKTIGKKTQYLVKWKGYPKSHNSWEPTECFNANFLKEYHAKQGNPSKKRKT